MGSARLTARRGLLAGLFAALIWLGSAATPTLAEAPALRGDPATYADEMGRLFGFLGAARTEAEARSIEDEIWRHWFLAPDAAAAELMDRAMDRRRVYDFAGAVEVLDDLIAASPDWAEAWNQRATVRFMQGDLTGSLADVEETLQREPRHFGALAGMALILMQQGRIEQAQTTLREAVKIDPFLRERALLVTVPGEDL